MLKEEGEHHIIYKATDTAVEGNAAARTNTIDWTISVSNANIRAVNIPYPYQIRADRVTLYAEVINGRTWILMLSCLSVTGRKRFKLD